jgi:hypothetical protein
MSMILFGLSVGYVLGQITEPDSTYNAVFIWALVAMAVLMSYWNGRDRA